MVPPESVRPDVTSTREQRVVVTGALIVIVAVLVTYAVLPFARRWQTREAEIDSVSARVSYLSSLVDRTSNLQSLADTRERALATEPRRVLHARSNTLAASALQTWLQEAADASRVVVTRLDVTPDTLATNGVPATLSAYGDIHGVAALLDVVQSGPRVMRLERLSVQRNAALIGAADVVQVTLQVRAPVLPQ